MNVTKDETARAEVGMVFQSFNLFPHMTIRENITLAPLRVKQMSEQEANAIADDLMQKVGIEATACAQAFSDSHFRACYGATCHAF